MNTFKGSIFALGLALLSATALEAAAAENSAPQMGSVTATEKSRSAQAFMDAAGMAASGGAPSVDLQSLKPSEARPSEFDPKANPRVYEISTQLRCLVCANETIAESNAQLAIDLRREVAEQVKAGKTDDEIIDFMVDRYGDYVLFKPPFKAKTWLLWLGPGVFFLRPLGHDAHRRHPPGAGASAPPRGDAGGGRAREENPPGRTHLREGRGEAQPELST
ncbi:MAG: cytochrome c-type biogenesis protein [Sutterella seckii]